MTPELDTLKRPRIKARKNALVHIKTAGPYRARAQRYTDVSTASLMADRYVAGMAHHFCHAIID